MKPIIAMVCLTALATGVLLADDREDAVAAEDRSNYVKILGEAMSLEATGKENKSPLMLVTAGGLYLKLKGTESKLSALKQEPTEEYEAGAEKGEPAPKEKPKAAFDFAQSAEEAFDAAEALAGDDGAKAVRALIKAVRDDKTSALVWAKDRGCANGPQVIRRVLPGGATHTFKLPFVGGLPASIGFQSTVPCQVTIVRSDTDSVIAAGYAINAVRTWRPTGKAKIVFTVKVKNLTRAAVAYQLLTN